MSTATAKAVVGTAAPLPGPRRPQGAAGSGQRRGWRGHRLRSVPAQAGPEEPGVPEDPLQLGEPMRRRLQAAVRALLADESVCGLKDAARLAAVVLFAKSRAPQGRWDDDQTLIWGAELGRWLGMSESTVHHAVLPALRASDALHSEPVVNELGHPTGLRCLAMPLWRARRSGGALHPLALSKVELATLLRLCEALFGPGWEPQDKVPTPPGLLAGRSGKGAATDRLGLLLMVLSTNSRGWLRLCPGSVDKDRGRPAATVGRLLGCSPSGGGKVLGRLEEAGIAQVIRKTTGTKMNGPSRVRLVAVARAHGRAVQEARREARPVFSDLADTACGDLGTGPVADGAGHSSDDRAPGSCSAGTADLADSAELHAIHASAGGVGGVCAGCGGFSGEAPSGDSPRPECACVREDCPAGPGTPGGQLTLVDGPGGPLCGEQPKFPAPTTGHQHQNLIASDGDGAPGRDAAGRVPDSFTAGYHRQQGRVPRPPVDLEPVVAPAGALWARLDREGARRLVVAALHRELTAVTAATDDPYRAVQVLAARLERRLAAQDGPDKVRDPVGWFLRRGLPRGADCTHPRCDEGTRMDTGGPCEMCLSRIAGLRALRGRVAAEVAADHPHAPPMARRREVEQRLREETAHAAEQRAARLAASAAVRIGPSGPNTALHDARRRDGGADGRAAAVVVADGTTAADGVACGGGCGRTTGDRISGLCPPCAEQTRAQFEPELDGLDGLDDAGQRLMLRLVRGAAAPAGPASGSSGEDAADHSKVPWPQRWKAMAVRPLTCEAGAVGQQTAGQRPGPRGRLVDADHPRGVSAGR